jgi:sec-independent protein translocase protein TatB
MFEVGFTEIVLILGLALLVLGPEKLPGLAQKVGQWTGRARAMARQLRTQLEHEVTLEELSRSKPMHTSNPSQMTTESDGVVPPAESTPHTPIEEVDVGAANGSGHTSYEPEPTDDSGSTKSAQ